MIDSQVRDKTHDKPAGAGKQLKLTRECDAETLRELPEVIVHRFEEEFVIGFLEDIFEVRQSDFVRRHRQFHQIRCLLVVEVVDNFGLPHLGLRLRRGRQGASSRRARQAPSRAPTPRGAGGGCAVVLPAALPWLTDTLRSPGALFFLRQLANVTPAFLIKKKKKAPCSSTKRPNTGRRLNRVSSRFY